MLKAPIIKKLFFNGNISIAFANNFKKSLKEEIKQATQSLKADSKNPNPKALKQCLDRLHKSIENINPNLSKTSAETYKDLIRSIESIAQKSKSKAEFIKKLLNQEISTTVKKGYSTVITALLELKELSNINKDLDLSSNLKKLENLKNKLASYKKGDIPVEIYAHIINESQKIPEEILNPDNGYNSASHYVFFNVEDSIIDKIKSFFHKAWSSLGSQPQTSLDKEHEAFQQKINQYADSYETQSLKEMVDEVYETKAIRASVLKDIIDIYNNYISPLKSSLTTEQTSKFDFDMSILNQIHINEELSNDDKSIAIYAYLTDTLISEDFMRMLLDSNLSISPEDFYNNVNKVEGFYRRSPKSLNDTKLVSDFELFSALRANIEEFIEDSSLKEEPLKLRNKIVMIMGLGSAFRKRSVKAKQIMLKQSEADKHKPDNNESGGTALA